MNAPPLQPQPATTAATVNSAEEGENSNQQAGSKNKLHWPHRTAIIVLLSVSGVLIWGNADLLLWWPAFYLAWVGFFPWVSQLGSLSFILGVILGLVIDMGVVVYSFGSRIEGAFIILPTAIISFLIGGGFLAGLIIAVVTGVFIVMNERVIEATQLAATK